VTDDGAETDLDLGHYERFLNVPTSQEIMLQEFIFQVIEKKREREFWKNRSSGYSYHQW
jgi:CTP synthase